MVRVSKSVLMDRGWVTALIVYQGRSEAEHWLLGGFGGAIPASAGSAGVALGTVAVGVAPVVGRGVGYRLPLMLGRWMVWWPLFAGPAVVP